jgi:hypothetical protein
VRWFCVALLAPWASLAQTAPLVSGVLLERDAPAESGELSVRTASNEVFRFRFGPQTRVERGGIAAEAVRLQPGDIVDVVPDRTPNADLRYALSIRVTAAWQPPRTALPARRPAEPGIDSVLFAGDALSFSGVVSRLSPARVVLRMRSGADQTIVLLKQTRYVASGEIVDADALKPNMHVFVRAAKSVYGELEAYQVVWGQILQPR